jgi:limonene-1,2-epoxide hydrolase
MIAVVVGEDEAMPGEWVSSWAETVIKYKDGRGPVKVWVNAVYKIENGKIALSRTFYNEADILEQLGYTFTNFSEL